MATISSQSTRSSGRVHAYAKKDYVAISAIGATVQHFEKTLQSLRVKHNKAGYRARTDFDGNGQAVIVKDSKGNVVMDPKYVQAYSLVQSFGPTELDPGDPESWVTAQRLGGALVKDRFPGHPALLSTEVNGRSGCVHNHIIVGAIHADTGLSVDSNVVTHTRLALAHDQVLAENGFSQRDDMVKVAVDAAHRLEEAKNTVLADIAEMPPELRPSDNAVKRQIIAAQKKVTFQGQTEVDAGTDREQRRLREFDRHRLNDMDRAIATDLGIPAKPERFSEIVLEARITKALADRRFTSWKELAETSRDHGVVITESKRGENVSYGMMLAQPDGSLAEPSRAHTRRGGITGSGKGLGEGFRRGDVEQAMERNAQLRAEREQQETESRRVHAQWLTAQAATRNAEADKMMQESAARTAATMASMEARTATLQSRLDSQLASIHARFAAQPEAPVDGGIPRGRDAASATALVQQTAAGGPVIVPSRGKEAMTPHASVTADVVDSVEPAPANPVTVAGLLITEPATRPAGVPWRSSLRGVKAKSTSSKVQQRIDGLAEVEEAYRDGGFVPDAAFEQRIKGFGIDEQFLDHYGNHLQPEMRRQLTLRCTVRGLATAEYETARDLRSAGRDLYGQLLKERAAAVRRDPTGWQFDPAVMELSERFQSTKAAFQRGNARVTALRTLVAEGRYEEAALKSEPTVARRETSALTEPQRTAEKDGGFEL